MFDQATPHPADGQHQHDDQHQEPDRFVRDNFTRVAWALVAMGATPEQALDTTQEAMIVACSKWHQVNAPGSSPLAFVRTVASRSLRSVQRRTAAEHRAQKRLEARPDAATVAAPADEKVVFDDEVRYVLDLLATLPPRQRQVMAYTVDGLSIEEIAELTGQSAATVRSNLRHARTKLKAMVAPQPEGGGDERRRVPGS